MHIDKIHETDAVPDDFDWDGPAPWDLPEEEFPGVEIFDSREAAARLQEEFGLRVDRAERLDGDRCDPTEKVAVGWLYRMVQDGDIGRRRLLEPAPTVVDALEDLIGLVPNAVSVLGLVRDAVRASVNTKTPFHMPPILLLGPPGVGKTYLARRIAGALGARFETVDVAGATGLSPLGGSSRVWRGADIGCVAKALISSTTASPMFLLDEIDKAMRIGGERGDMTSILHSLLEPEQSREFQDDFLHAHFSAQHCLWIATANGTSELPASLRDRFVCISMSPPERAQMMTIAATVLAEVMRTQFGGWFEGKPGEDVLAGLAGLHPRAVRRTAMLACQCAAAAGRRIVTPWDVRSAQSRLGA